mgnify:CR=1 FL=1
MFFSIAIIIVAYLPIFTLQRHEGRIFAPMAYTVVSALAFTGKTAEAEQLAKQRLERLPKDRDALRGGLHVGGDLGVWQAEAVPQEAE